MQVGTVIVVAEKAGLAVVAPLHDVQGHAIQVNSGAAGHGTGKRRPGAGNARARSGRVHLQMHPLAERGGDVHQGVQREPRNPPAQ